MERGSEAVPLSEIEGIQWPAIVPPAAATLLAVQWQLECTQWWTPEAIVEQQFRQLRELAAHASANVPYYRSHLSRAGLASVEDLAPDTFRRWPLLPAGEVKQQRAAPPAPACYAHALVLRDHLWHGRDLGEKLAAIGVPPTMASEWWGTATSAAFRTGPLVLDSRLTDPKAQLDWLAAQRPGYLLTTPGHLRALLQHSLKTGNIPPSIHQVITFSGRVAPELHQQLARVWQAKLVDAYSCEPPGLIALQCPSQKHWHVQAENVYVELLRPDGTPCAPGERGRVVVTVLHDFAAPVLRYDSGDYAELGGACPCGRGLPVLRNIDST